MALYERSKNFLSLIGKLNILKYNEIQEKKFNLNIKLICFSTFFSLVLGEISSMKLKCMSLLFVLFLHN